MCAVSKQGRCSVQYTVLLLKSDMLADSKDYNTPCTTSSAVTAVIHQCIMSCCKWTAWTVIRHWPWASRDSGGRSSAIIAPWQTIGQSVVNVWRVKPLETHGPRTKRLTSQCRCVRSGGDNGQARVATQYCLTVLTVTSNSCYKLSYCMDSDSSHKPASRDSNVLFISVCWGMQQSVSGQAGHRLTVDRWDATLSLCSLLALQTAGDFTWTASLSDVSQ